MGQRVWPVACLQTDRQTDMKENKTEEALSGLSELLPSAHDQGAVQKAIKVVVEVTETVRAGKYVHS